MSLQKLKVEELRAFADRFATTDVSSATTKNELINILQEEGLGFNEYKKFMNNDQEIEQGEVKENEPEFISGPVLLKMDRNNPTFEVLGYKFTTTHPYIAMSADNAQKIIDLYEGFRLASPREAKDYYS